MLQSKLALEKERESRRRRRRRVMNQNKKKTLRLEMKRRNRSDESRGSLNLTKSLKTLNNRSSSNRSIRLPDQNIYNNSDLNHLSHYQLEDHSGRRTDAASDLSSVVDDLLLVRLNHYNPSTRKQALISLKVILSTPEGRSRDLSERSSVGKVIRYCSSLIVDQNSGVRSSLKQFFAWYLSSIDPKTLEPFCSVILHFTSLALSHIFLEIRIDSIHIIDILLRLSPGSVTGGWPIDGNSHLDSLSGSVCQESFGLRLVRLYLSLVGCESRKNSSNQTTQLSSESKLIVFRSLARFIKLSTVEESDRDDETSRRVSNRMFKNEFSDQSGYNSFVSLTTTAPAKFTRNDTVADHHPERRSPEMIIPSNLLGVDPCDENSHRFESFSEAFLIQNQGYTTHFNQNDESDEKFKLNQKPDLKNSSDSNHDVYHKSSQRDEEHFSPDSPLKLLRLLNPIILSTLLDTMPDIFTNQILQNNHKNPVRNSRCDDAIGGGSVKLELVWSLMSILRDLWRLNYYSCGTGHGRDDDCDESMAEEDRKSLEGLVGRISCYFVFGDENVFKVDLATRRILDELNLIYCDLVSLLSLSRNRSKSNNNIKQTKTDSKFKIQLGRVGDYIIERVLKRQENEVFKRILDVDDFRSVLGVIWLLIKKGSKDHSRSSDGIRGDDRSDGDAVGEDEGEDACEDISSKVLEGLVDYLEALKLNSEVRALGYEFIFKIFVLDDLRGSDCFETLDQFSETTQLRLVELVLKLPKLIFELGNKNPRFTIMILSFLHRLVSRPMNFFRECLPGLIKQLVPLFCYYSSNPATANKRDNRDGEDEMRMISLGLYSKMPSECQLLMRSIAWYLVNQDDIPCEGLRFAIERAGATV